MNLNELFEKLTEQDLVWGVVKLTALEAPQEGYLFNGFVRVPGTTYRFTTFSNVSFDEALEDAFQRYLDAPKEYCKVDGEGGLVVRPIDPNEGTSQPCQHPTLVEVRSYFQENYSTPKSNSDNATTPS